MAATAQLPGRTARVGRPILRPVPDYGSLVAYSHMIEFLAKVARDKRKGAEIKIARVAAAADLDTSTLYDFERGSWPRDPDQMISGYAEELEIAPADLWREALELWLAASSGDPLDLDPLEEVVEDAERDAADDADRSGEEPGQSAGEGPAT